jgi:hypothetical protein
MRYVIGDPERTLADVHFYVGQRPGYRIPVAVANGDVDTAQDLAIVQLDVAQVASLIDR